MDSREVTQDLHRQVRDWHVIYEDMTDLQELLSFFLTVFGRFQAAAQEVNATGGEQLFFSDETTGTVDYLQSKVSISLR